jgi:hypothetical protein
MSSNRRRIFGVATAAALAVSAAVGVSASSAGTIHRTRIQLVGGAGNGANSVVGGQLETNRHCLRLRKVTMYKETSSGWARVDAILSSAHGAWAFHYQSNDPDPTQVKFTVTRDTQDGVVCKEDERLATLSPSPRADTRAASGRAEGGTTTYSTSILWRAGVLDDTGTYWIEMGQLNTNEVCQGLRKVIVYVDRGHGYRRTDTVLSSPEGVWAFHVERTENNATEDVRWVVTPDTRRNGSVVCKGTELEQTV